MKKLLLLSATFGGVGYVPFAPGTVGSLASFIIWGPLIILESPFFLRLIILIIIIIIGIWASNESIKHFKVKDPKEVIVDEVSGMGVTLILTNSSYLIMLLGFVFFRFFDILKPWPINKIEILPNGWGIMLDDVMAGIYSLLILSLIEKFL